ncbi:hypothetical protein [Kutzneria kofuensis]|uniref:hypothetical protein n=1 Tax=Kutzneria kofuensis TaxID=103725 RepID=UPI0031EBA86B
MRVAVVGCQDVVAVRPFQLETVDVSASPDPLSAALAWMRSDLADPVSLARGRCSGRR